MQPLIDALLMSIPATHTDYSLVFEELSPSCKGLIYCKAKLQ
jgi:hypothetical protein